MKPDQHKKKRSAQYKRKHGIQDKSKDNKGKDDDTSSSKSSSSSAASGSKSSQVQREGSRENDTGRGKDVRRGGARKVADSSDVGSRESSHSEEDAGVGGTFSRRKVLSNWDRYEAPLPRYEDRSDVTLRGADFRSLLATSGEAEAQFRFEDEKDWEADDAGEAQLPTGGALSLDCDLLAVSLQAIPLHRRLNISPESLTEDIVERFNEEAASHASCEQQTLHHTPLKPRLSITETTASSILDNLLRRVEHKPLQLNLDVSLNPKQQSKSADVLKFDFSVPAASSEEVPVALVESPDLETGQDPEESVVASDETVDRPVKDTMLDRGQDELDDELDVLLSLDSATHPDTPTTDREKEDIIINNVEKEEYQPNEEELKDLKKDSVVEPTKKQHDVPQPKEETVDLEDWLDSVLDD
ncbi:cell death regulator Aven-like isoform X1 [Branchiostoma lanceolatum]|uniref:cell death regulator Aven-like isoform X1 n=1 Tax=Branchiostoma lanceolatum TaxID=7740 RepID=UPI003451B4A6